MHQFLLALLILSADTGNRDAKFVPIFDGKTLAGWHTLPGGKWEVQDGVIVGTSDKNESRHGLLVSDKQYGDFVVKFKFRLAKGNSGFYFRSEKVDQAVGVLGFQAEVADDGAAGGLYETGGRTWVAKPDPELIRKTYKPGEWNEMVVSATGGNISVQLNGISTAQLKDDPGRPRGHFAMQLHGGMDMEVMFKDIHIRTEDGQ